MAAASAYETILSVSEAEYRGLLLSFDLLSKQTKRRINIGGDFNPVIRRMRGEIYCKAPDLYLLQHKATKKLQSWPTHEFLYMQRDWNQSVDRFVSAALQQEKGKIITLDRELEDLMVLNRLNKLLTPGGTDQVIKLPAITRSAV